MFAAVYEGANAIGLEEVPKPTPPKGWSLVEVGHVGICGTDLAIFSGLHPRAKTPLIMGHEFSGRVVEPGNGGHLEEGQKVVVEPLMVCNRCRACRTGNSHVCESLRLFGIDYPGGMAQFTVVPAERVYPVPDTITLEHAAVIEPLAVAVHAVRISSFRPRDTTVVHGAGPVGLLIALVLKASGASQVIVSEPNRYRLDVARRLGLTAVDANADPTSEILSHTDGDGADVVFDAAGSPGVASQLAATCRILGQVVLVGIYKKPTALDLQALAFKEVSMRGSRVYTSYDFEVACALAAGGRVPLEPLISHVLPLSEVTGGFDLLSKGGAALKVMFQVVGEGRTA
jgi:(R,R)-butanediol dehydrogenase/meso-butanediol dehydrogenase/diacetyl reductase